MKAPETAATRLARSLLRVGALVGVGAGLTALGTRRWAAATRLLTAQLYGTGRASHAGPPATEHYDPRELVGLPAPVARFFRAVLTDGQPIVERIEIEMSGRLNLSATGACWKPFTARQSIVARRPGFVWDARVALCPGVAVRVVDAYLAGEGRLDVAALGLVPVAHLRDDGDMARAELIRWFAELAWLPTALLPSQGVRWEGVDAHAANATLVDGPLSVTLRFSFSASGPIESVRAEARAAGVGGRVRMMPWEGRWSDYQRHHCMLVPTRGDAAWLRPEGWRRYFVGNVTAIENRSGDDPDVRHRILSAITRKGAATPRRCARPAATATSRNRSTS